MSRFSTGYNANGIVLKKVFAATLLSLITGTGGHFFNQRWDRALLFFALILLYPIGLYFWINYAFQPVAEGFSGSQLSNLLEQALYLLIFGSAAILALSTLISFRDAYKSSQSVCPKRTLSGVVGATLLSLISMLIIATEASTAISYWQAKGDLDQVLLEGDSNSLSDYRQFWHYESFGGFDYQQTEPAPIQAGDKYLNLAFRYQGDPAVGINLKVGVNRSHESEPLTTDENGLVSIPIAGDRVQLNKLEVNGWSNPVTKEPLVLVNGHEAKKGEESYQKFDWHRDNGITLTTADSADKAQLVFSLRPRLQMNWPSQQKQPAALETMSAVISWLVDEKATDYLVKISNVERRGTTTSYSELTQLYVKENQLPLTSLAVIDDEGAKAQEYSVSIIAFDSEGNFVNESDSMHDSSFVLPDGKALFALPSGLPPTLTAEPSDYQQQYEDDKRFKAINQMIDDGLYDAAEHMLDLLDEHSMPEKQVALKSLILANKGKCEEAHGLAATLAAEDECKCTLKKLNKLCPPQ
ncbi:MAG: hypothetical protein V7752_04280 [Halopseudomonas sp.]